MELLRLLGEQISNVRRTLLTELFHYGCFGGNVERLALTIKDAWSSRPPNQSLELETKYGIAL